MEFLWTMFCIKTGLFFMNGTSHDHNKTTAEVKPDTLHL